MKFLDPSSFTSKRNGGGGRFLRFGHKIPDRMNRIYRMDFVKMLLFD
jgi:hypothetical protein